MLERGVHELGSELELEGFSNFTHEFVVVISYGLISCWFFVALLYTHSSFFFLTFAQYTVICTLLVGAADAIRELMVFTQVVREPKWDSPS